MKIYLSGGMTGIKDNNFPLFNMVAAELRSYGHDVLNPAELDANEDLTKEWSFYLRRDIKHLMDCDDIAMLPGWEKSRGAKLEKYIAEALGMTVWYCYEGKLGSWYLLPHDPHNKAISILDEAETLVLGDRGSAYGHPADDMARTGKIWAAVLGVPEVTAAQVALCMVGVKMSREVNKPKRDNRVDGAGYFQCLDMIREKEGT